MPGVRRRAVLYDAVILYQITNGRAGDDVDAWLRGLSSRADFIQIREAGLTTRELAELVRRVVGMGLRVLVNDRLDVALAAGAAGVHLRSGGMAAEVVRAVVPAGFVISVACHGEADVRAAAGADYALLAPVFSPLSKQDNRVPLGLAELRRIAGLSEVPILALGGITEANAGVCVEAGAAGVAGISLFGCG